MNKIHGNIYAHRTHIHTRWQTETRTNTTEGAPSAGI